MNQTMADKQPAKSLPARMRGLFADRRGVAAVEFAFIAPILLSLYLMTMEVSQGIETNKKIGRVGSMVADLVTQQQQITKAELEAIMQIGGALLQPYNRSLPSITVTAIKITDDEVPKVEVAWSRKMKDGAFSEPITEGTEIDIPEKLEIRNTFLIRVSGELDYRPVITWSADEKGSLGLAAAFDNIQMKETYYLRPRMSTEIPCTGC